MGVERTGVRGDAVFVAGRIIRALYSALTPHLRLPHKGGGPWKSKGYELMTPSPSMGEDRGGGGPFSGECRCDR